MYIQYLSAASELLQQDKNGRCAIVCERITVTLCTVDTFIRLHFDPCRKCSVIFSCILDDARSRFALSVYAARAISIFLAK